VDLGGTWRAIVGDEALRLGFAEPDLDDAAWHELNVPGHWRHTPAFRDTDGPVLHRRRFTADAPAEDERAWLVFEGLFYQGDVWLDGAYLGDTEGYFNRHTFEVTEALRTEGEHVLGVEVTCSRPEDKTHKRNITGLFQHWESGDPTWNPGGIWRPVHLDRTGPVRARDLRVVCRDADATRAVVALRAELDTVDARSVRIRTTIGDIVDVGDHPLAEGSNFVEWTVTVPEPELWWPHALGGQPLHDVRVEVLADDRASHVLERRIGLRSVRMDDWVLSVNGERLFLKGARQGPSHLALADMSAADLRRDVELAREAGLDLLRLQGHISRPELYEAADELGLLLWQDFPLHLGYGRSIRKQAVRQAAAAVDTLGHHPSIVVWCGHDMPVAVDRAPGTMPRTREMLRWAAGQELPTWNRTFLDHGVRRAFEKADGSRPVVAHSGAIPHVGSTGTDSHLWFGWFHGDDDDLAAFARRMPRMVRFVTGLGAESPPDGLDVPWPEIGHEVLERRVPPSAFVGVDEWRAAAQGYQADLLKRHVETLRRLKYRPTGGFCVADFADGRPGTSFAVLDHERNPKPAYLALVDACRPLVVIADQLPEVLAPGDALAVDVHVVSDLRHELPRGRVDATMTWAGGSTSWHWTGDVPPDAVVRIGTVQAVVPDEPGELTLDLQVVAGERVATNRYRALVEPA
jgi:beta-mannosidase